MRKTLLTVAAVAAMSVTMSMTALAAGWQKSDAGWWYGTNENNTTWYANGWQWVDGNGDGTAECYYFDQNGYMMANTTTPDGYTVNADGAWVENGTVQTKQLSQTTQPQVNAEGVDADGGKWVEDANGKKYMKPDGSFVVDSIWLIDPNADGTYEIYVFDENGYLCKGTEIDYVLKKPYGSNRWGIYDENGLLQTNYYKGGKDIDFGPYEVVKKNGEWHCVNGTIPASQSKCSEITNDYARDASWIKMWVDDYITRITSVSGVAYRN